MAHADFVEFLTARLDEDEHLARAAAGPVPRDAWHALDWYNGEFEDGRTARVDVHGRAAGPLTSEGALERAHGEHIARHDPPRVLAEVAAKRKLIDFAFTYAAEVDNERGDGHTAQQIRAGECADQGGHAYMDVLRLLALPFADHPDYDESWRP